MQSLNLQNDELQKELKEQRNFVKTLQSQVNIERNDRINNKDLFEDQVQILTEKNEQQDISIKEKDEKMSLLEQDISKQSKYEQGRYQTLKEELELKIQQLESEINAKTEEE